MKTTKTEKQRITELKDGKKLGVHYSITRVTNIITTTFKYNKIEKFRGYKDSTNDFEFNKIMIVVDIPKDGEKFYMARTIPEDILHCCNVPSILKELVKEIRKVYKP